VSEDGRAGLHLPPVPLQVEIAGTDTNEWFAHARIARAPLDNARRTKQHKAGQAHTGRCAGLELPRGTRQRKAKRDR
jgi:urease accessory protein UreE